MAHGKNIYLVFHRNTLWNTLFWDSVEAGDVSRQSYCTSGLAWFFFPTQWICGFFIEVWSWCFFFTYLVCLSQTLVHFPPLCVFFFSEYTIVSPEILQKKCIKRKECKVVNFTAYLLQSRASSMCTFLLLLLQMHLANKCIELLMWFVLMHFDWSCENESNVIHFCYRT